MYAAIEFGSPELEESYHPRISSVVSQRKVSCYFSMLSDDGYYEKIDALG